MNNITAAVPTNVAYICFFIEHIVLSECPNSAQGDLQSCRNSGNKHEPATLPTGCKTWLWCASKCTENIWFWSEYKEPSLPYNWLMTQAALHIMRTVVTFEQQVQPFLSFSSCSFCSSLFSLCILKTSAKLVQAFFSSSFLSSALSFTPTPQQSQFWPDIEY